MKINENILKTFVGIQFEYGQCTRSTCDCFGLFVLICKENLINSDIYNKIYTPFKKYFFNQKICFEAINSILIPYKVYDSEYRPYELIVITANNRIHCGISFMYKKHMCVLHTSEKNGVIITFFSRFMAIGSIITRYDLLKL